MAWVKSSLVHPSLSSKSLRSNSATTSFTVYLLQAVYSVVTPAYKLPVFYLHDVIAFVQVLRFFREDDWSALLPSAVDFREAARYRNISNDL